MPAALVLLFQIAAYAPPAAVDHVATMVVHAYSTDPAASRSTVYRSGHYMRVDSQDPFRSQSSYTDLNSGLTTTVLRDGEGVVQRVTIGTPVDRNGRLPPTGRRDRLLGQDCTIWRFLAERQTSGAEICETGDGILLRHAFWYPPGNRTVVYMRATAVERRPVRPDEVLPPRDMLALAAAPPPAPSPAGTASDYEVEMVGDDPADGSYVLRRHARYYSSVRRDDRGVSATVGNGAVLIRFDEDEVGRPVALEIVRGSRFPAGRRLRIEPRWEAVAGREDERVLGENCTWQENLAIQSTDRNYECRTADGIALKTEVGGHWGPVRRFTARRLSRRPLTDADFAVPARALDWGHWGITPAP